MGKSSRRPSYKSMKEKHINPNKENQDEKSIDIDYTAKDYPIVEHISNARLMPMTGPYGGLDLMDTYEYGTAPESPFTPLEPYEIVMDKNTQKKK